MTQTENLFLKIFSCSVFGNKIEGFKEFEGFCEWNELFTLCRKHSVVCITYQTVLNFFKGKIPNNILLQWKQEALMSGAVQAARSQAFYSVYKKLGENGIQPIVLKGETIRPLYKIPESRTSVDEDLLIEESNYNKMCQVLSSLGFEQTMHKNEDGHWFNKKLSLYFEVHFYPFPNNKNYLKWNEQFNGCFKRTTLLQNGISALSRTDNLIFLILHAAKHFIYSGVGVKQLADIALFLNEYKNEIDFNYVKAVLKNTGVLKFAKGMAAFINEYMCPFMLFEKNSVCDEALADDIIKGGSLGNGSLERKHSAAVTSSAYKKESVIKKILFPPKERLKAEYKFAEKHPILLPFAWLIRIFSFLKKDKKGKSFTTGKQRLELIKKYNLIN